MGFEEKYGPVYRRLFEFHRRHESARTEAEIAEMSRDADWFGDGFKGALLMAVLDEIGRGRGLDRD